MVSYICHTYMYFVHSLGEALYLPLSYNLDISEIWCISIETTCIIIKRNNIVIASRHNKVCTESHKYAIICIYPIYHKWNVMHYTYNHLGKWYAKYTYLCMMHDELCVNKLLQSVSQ